MHGAAPGSPLSRLLFYYPMKKEVQEKYPWFKVKGYPHIGLPLTYADADRVVKYVQSAKKISVHAFKPFIFRETKVRKYRRKLDEFGHNLNERFADEKKRPISYANHFDAQIYSYYGHLLNEKYEERLRKLNIQACVTAYRFIPRDDRPEKGKSSVHFAKEAFDAIRGFPDDQFCVLVIDISSFFPSLKHSYLKRKWADIWKEGSVSLEPDHYNLFKSLTKPSYILEHRIFNACKDHIWVKKRSGGLRQKRISHKNYLYENNAVAYCSNDEFEEKILKKGLVTMTIGTDGKEPKDSNKGIPQGTPISAILANIYMLDFDLEINTWLSERGGFFRRYSDDMFFICRYGDEQALLEKLKKELQSAGELSFQESKTQLVHFWRNADSVKCAVMNNKTKSWFRFKNLEYLGFEFDGERVLIKNASLAKFFRKMKLNVRRGAHYARRSKPEDRKIYTRRLYKKFSWLGAGRRRRYIPNPGNPKKRIPANFYDWGNFLTYMQLAVDVMKDDAIRKQLRRHHKVLRAYIAEKQAQVDGVGV